MVARPMAKRLLPIATCVLLATSLAACGSDASKKVDVQQIRSVVLQFAASDGAKACDLLSPDALVNVYGGFSLPPDQAKAACVKKSVGFKGQPIRITKLNVVDDATARVTALNPKGDITYNVAVRRFGPAWRIDEITQSKTE
jgi:hypothetical protein